jgi:hypothetical protein
MKPEQWLKNFKGDEEEEIAYDLLKNFMYFPKPMTRELLRSAMRKITPRVIDFNGSAADAKALWATISRRLFVIPVRGETPSPADSGFHYARLARDTFGLRDEQLPDFPQILLPLQDKHADGTPNIVVFVDDFIGSGSQFIEMWYRPFTTPAGTILSCNTVAATGNTKFFYCPLVATSYGMEAIRDECGGGITLCPAHILSPEYNALHPNSRVWTNEAMREKGQVVLKQIADRVPMPDSSGGDPDDWKGFHELGLNLVLNDAMPDACLGVFRFNQNDWYPLFHKAG